MCLLSILPGPTISAPLVRIEEAVDVKFSARSSIVGLWRIHHCSEWILVGLWSILLLCLLMSHFQRLF